MTEKGSNTVQGKKRTPLDIVKEIESKYPVETITAGGLQLWPYLRIYLFTNSAGIQPAPSGVKLLKSFLSGIFYGFSNLFKKHDVILYSDTMERRRIREKYHDKSIEYIAEILPGSLDIEIPLPSHFSRRDIPTKKIISKIPFYFCETLYAKFCLCGLKVQNSELLDSIYKEYNIQGSYMPLAKRMVSQYRGTLRLIKRFRPRAAFIGCYYTNSGRVAAFRDKGVVVTEIQHGVISNDHLAYNLAKKFDYKYFPHNLLSFGNSEKVIAASDGFYINSSNVFPVGSYYLDHLNANPVKYERVEQLRKRYRHVVCVSGQNHYTEPLLIDFLNRVSEISSDIVFIFVPRDSSFDSSKYNMNKSVIVSSDLNCYEMISLCDFHSTVYSTCALEAPSLGVPNIMINIDGLAQLHYGKRLSDSVTTMYANTPEEFIMYAGAYVNPGRDEIRERNRDIICPDYRENVKKVLNEMSLL